MNVEKVKASICGNPMKECENSSAEDPEKQGFDPLFG
jgi:hypothetical protein